MTRTVKSASIRLARRGFCLVALVILAACGEDSSMRMPHIFGDNEVPQAAMDEPRLVTTAVPNASAKAAWPRLGDVPAKPKDFTPLPMSSQTMTEMETDRAEAARLRDSAENPPPFAQPNP